jgi:FAD/FMN-containing dehydrogenase/ferredoxin
MSQGSLLASHIGISPERFLETPPGPRGETIREKFPDLHGHVDGGLPVEERKLPPLVRERAVALKAALAGAADADDRGTLDARLLTDDFLRSEYRKDQNVYLGPFFLDRLTRATPDVVFQPASAAEVGAALAWAKSAAVPVTLRGAGSTAMGGSVPAAGGLVLDLTRLDAVEILESDGLAVLGAGARFRPVHEKLQARGLALRVYTSNLGGTFAGWFATGGIGLNAYSGGRARDAVRWAEAVLLSGDVVRLFRGRDLELVVFEKGSARFTHLEGPEARDWFAERGLPPLSLDDLCGTEGQLAVLTRLAIETQPLPEPACFLLGFASAADSFAFVDWVRKWGGTGFPFPLNVKWLSASHLHHARKAWADDDARAWRRRPSLLSSGAGLPWKRLAGPAECGAAISDGGAEPAAYLYVDFASADAGRGFVRALGRAPVLPAIFGAESVRFGAERFRPQSVKRLGPGLLAAEIVMPAENVPAFLRVAPSVAKGPRADLDAEVYYLGDGTALVIAGYLIDHRRGSFLFDLLLAPALVDLAMDRFQGRPYVLGRWQSGYFRAAQGGERARRLRDLKEKTDPAWILGRGAFFGDGYRGALGKLASAGFAPGVRVMRTIYEVPFLRPIARMLAAISGAGRGPLGRHARTATEAPPTTAGTFEPLAAAARAGTCVNCGECNSVCPVFRDSSVRLPQMLTHLGERVAEGGEPGATGSVLLDLCMRCGNCEEVCQAGIPHLPMYEAMQRAADGARPRDRERQFAILGGIRTSPRYAREFLRIRGGGYLKRTPASLPGAVRFVLQRAENDDGPAATCIHCGACVPVCPTSANLEFQGEDPRSIVTDQSRCIGCGTCVEVCPANHLNGGQTLRVMEAPTLDWVHWMGEEMTPTQGLTPASEALR